MTLAFGNRAAVYCEMKLYDECLESIKLARQEGNAAENSRQLDSLEARCKKLTRRHTKFQSFDPWSFFKLSRAANEKISFIINSLEGPQKGNLGRLIITTQDLKTGDVICIEEPFFKFIDRGLFSYSRCYSCLKSNNLNLVPCFDCTEGFYLKNHNRISF